MCNMTLRNPTIPTKTKSPLADKKSYKSLELISPAKANPRDSTQNTSEK